MLAIIAVSLMYWLHIPNPFTSQPAPLVLRWRYPRDAREPRDERERLIDLRALRVAAQQD